MIKRIINYKYCYIIGIFFVALLGSVVAYASQYDFYGECHYTSMGSNSSESIELCASARKIDPNVNLWEWIYEIKVPDNNTFAVTSFGVSTGCVSSPYGEKHPNGWEASSNSYFNPGSFDWISNDPKDWIRPSEKATFSFIVDKEPIFDGAAGAGAGSIRFTTTETLGCPGADEQTSVQCPVSAGGNIAVVTFNNDDTNPLIANGTAADATTGTKPIVGGPLNNAPSSGSAYNVTLYSFSDDPTVAYQDNQRFYIILKDNNGNTVYTSAASDDIPNNATSQQTRYSNQIINNASQAVAVHFDPVPEILDQRVVPVCASFEYVAPSPPPPPPPGKLIINTDSWFRDASITQGDNLQVTSKAMVISGKDIHSDDGTIIQNYSLPGSGELNWDKMYDLMVKRAMRGLNTRKGTLLAKGMRSPGGTCQEAGVIYELWLDYNLDPCSGAKVNNISLSDEDKKNYILFIEGNGSLVFGSPDRPLIFHGNGILVDTHPDDIAAYINNKTPIHSGDREITINGEFKPASPNDQFGYVALGDQSRVILGPGAAIQNATIFTNGILTIKANTTDRAREHKSVFVANQTILPEQSEILHDMIFSPSSISSHSLLSLFQDFLLPGANESP